MTLSQYEAWFRQKYHRTSSALTCIILALADMVSIMACIGGGFFLVKIIYLSNLIHQGIAFKTFVSYWPYMPAFTIVFAMNNLYPATSLAPAE